VVPSERFKDTTLERAPTTVGEKVFLKLLEPMVQVEPAASARFAVHVDPVVNTVKSVLLV
jgi:hypothetical protein